MSNDIAASDKVPVYLSFKTFRAAIQNLRTHGLPAAIDRSTFDSRSGQEQTQIISALKFLALIDESNRTQQALRDLKEARENSGEEKALLSELLRQRYAKVFALDLENTTPNALEVAIGEYGATGTTRDRAVRFFIKAAEYAGIKLSTRLTKGLRSRPPTPHESLPSDATTEADAEKNNGSRTPKRRTKKPQGQTNPETAGNAMKQIALPKVNGTLSISGTFNPFGLVGNERKLVYKIIDLMTAFEENPEAEIENEKI
jgi:hypothetical protein